MKKGQKQVKAVGKASQSVVAKQLKKFHAAAHQVYAFQDFVASQPGGTFTIDFETGENVPASLASLKE